MRGRFQKTLTTWAAVVLAVPILLQGATPSAGQVNQGLEEQVRHELLMLPYYSVFDRLAFQVDGDHVVLLGEVARPTLKRDAENAVKRIAGVTSVTNDIEVLPFSAHDDHIRLAVLRAVYAQYALNRYALGVHTSIHIIVRNGNVTLDGVVARDMDKTIAGIKALGVPGVFSVTNNIEVKRA